MRPHPVSVHGDSGGPTYMDVETSSETKRRVIGITSHAYDPNDYAKGGVDTRVDVWLDWIDDKNDFGLHRWNPRLVRCSRDYRLPIMTRPRKLAEKVLRALKEKRARPVSGVDEGGCTQAGLPAPLLLLLAGLVFGCCDDALWNAVFPESKFQK